MKGVRAATVTPRPGEKWCLSAKRVVVVVEERTKDKALHPSIYPSVIRAGLSIFAMRVCGVGPCCARAIVQCSPANDNGVVVPSALLPFQRGYVFFCFPGMRGPLRFIIISRGERSSTWCKQKVVEPIPCH